MHSQELGFTTNKHKTDLNIIEIPQTELTLVERAALLRAHKEAKEQEYQIASEICKRYLKGDRFNFILMKKGSIFSIILDNVSVGSFILKDSGKTKSISMIMLNDNLKGKGFGKQLYIKLNTHFQQTDGSLLMSDPMKLSSEAENLWKALVRDGLAEEMGIETANGQKRYIFRSLPR